MVKPVTVVGNIAPGVRTAVLFRLKDQAVRQICASGSRILVLTELKRFIFVRAEKNRPDQLRIFHRADLLTPKEHSYFKRMMQIADQPLSVTR